MLHHTGPVRLESGRLILRPLAAVDAEAAFANWTGDPAVARFMRWNCHRSAAETRAWLAQCALDCRDPRHYEWAIVLKELGEPIGSLSLFLKPDGPGREAADVGYAIGRAWWGQGIATEALRLAMGHLIRVVGVRHFTGEHAPDNPASGAVMRHAGLRCVGEGSYTSFDGAKTFPSRTYRLDLPDSPGRSAGDWG